MQLDAKPNRSILEPRHRPPPNYFSRSLQAKMLVMVFLFMSVLVLMEKARDPASWRWMWQLDRQAGPAQPALPDTRPPRTPEAPDSGSEPLVTGSIPRGPSEIPPESPIPDTLDRLRIEGWSRTLNRLPVAERRLLRTVLWKIRHDQPLTSDQIAAWQPLVAHLDDQWTSCLADVQAAVADPDGPLSTSQREAARAVIEEALAAWQTWRATLQAVTPNGAATERDRQQLDALQAVLDQRALSLIEDNAPLQRTAEYEAWFRLWEKLAACSADQLAAAPGPVSFVQLFSQPAAYRGRLITVRGVARAAYYALAPGNEYSITGYYVFAVQVAPRDDSPLRVFCLELPPGFPEVASAAESSAPQRLNARVEFAGYFFKRGVYSTADGPQLAPVVLARLTRWQPVAPPVTRSALPGLGWWLSGIGGAAVLAVGFAWWAYRRSNWSPSRFPHRAGTPSVLTTLSDEDVHGSTQETLRALAGDTERADSPSFPSPAQRDGHQPPEAQL